VFFCFLLFNTARLLRFAVAETPLFNALKRKERSGQPFDAERPLLKFWPINLFGSSP